MWKLNKKNDNFCSMIINNIDDDDEKQNNRKERKLAWRKEKKLKLMVDLENK